MADTEMSERDAGKFDVLDALIIELNQSGNFALGMELREVISRENNNTNLSKVVELINRRMIMPKDADDGK